MTERTVIRLVDDDDDQRTALRFLLSAAGYEVTDFGSAYAFLSEDDPCVAGCAILDLQMPGMDGLTLLSHLRERNYPVPVIFLSAHGDIPSTVEAMKRGSLDFLEKPVDPSKLVTLLASIIEKDKKRRNTNMEPDEARRRLTALSERQRKVARLLASGLLKRQVAERLGINYKTVDAHAYTIYTKLGLHSVAELSALFAAADGER